MDKSLDRKNIIWNMVGSTFSAFNSLFFSIIATRINGENEAGIFIYCFATSCLFYFIANYCGRTFQVTDITNQNSDTDYIYNRIITCVLMIVISAAFCLIKGYDLFKTTIMLILCTCKSIEAFAESLYAIIQKKEKLYRVGISVFLKAVACVIAFLIVDLLTHNLILACLCTVIVNILFILLYDSKSLKDVGIIKTKFSKEAILRIFKIGFFTFILTFLGTYLINAPRYAIDDLMGDNIQTIFGIIIMPATFMGLLGQYIIQPSLTKLSHSLENKDYDSLKRIIRNILLIIVALGTVVFIVALVLEVPVLHLVYGVELNPYYAGMMIIILGSIFYSLSAILSAILIAMRKTFAQVVTYGIIAVIATFMAQVLVGRIEVLGACLTYCITMFAVTIVFFVLTLLNMKKLKKEWENNTL